MKLTSASIQAETDQPGETGAKFHHDGNSISTRRRFAAGALALGLLLSACASTAAVDPDESTNEPTTTTTTTSTVTGQATAESGSSLDLSIGGIPENLAPLADTFTKHIDVWGISIVATSGTDDSKVSHAANVMAQYLDNDADGVPDNPAVVDAMIDNKAILLMVDTQDELEGIDNLDAIFDFVGAGGQDLYGEETNPGGGRFDIALEEVHHLILNTGWAEVFPAELAQSGGSAVALAMDIARGGHFESLPDSYPDGAWYTYDDDSCDYRCMITEYTYWAHTSLLGVQEGRAGIDQEWRLDTAAEVQNGDLAVTAILEDSRLGLPTLAPDGNYTPQISPVGSDIGADATDFGTAMATSSAELRTRLAELVGSEELPFVVDVELTDSRDVAGYAEPLDESLERWRIVIGPVENRTEQDHVLAHEYGHVVAGNGSDNYVVLESCETINLYGLCPNADSVIYQFIQTYWNGPALDIWDELRGGDEVLDVDKEPVMIDRIDSHPELVCQFVTDEAKVDPAEDFAETYAALILGTVGADGCGSAKVSWLESQLLA